MSLTIQSESAPQMWEPETLETLARMKAFDLNPKMNKADHRFSKVLPSFGYSPHEITALAYKLVFGSHTTTEETEKKMHNLFLGKKDALLELFPQTRPVLSMLFPSFSRLCHMLVQPEKQQKLKSNAIYVTLADACVRERALTRETISPKPLKELATKATSFFLREGPNYFLYSVRQITSQTYSKVFGHDFENRVDLKSYSKAEMLMLAPRFVAICEDILDPKKLKDLEKDIIYLTVIIAYLHHVYNPKSLKEFASKAVSKLFWGTTKQATTRAYSEVFGQLDLNKLSPKDQLALSPKLTYQFIDTCEEIVHPKKRGVLATDGIYSSVVIMHLRALAWRCVTRNSENLPSHRFRNPLSLTSRWVDVYRVFKLTALLPSEQNTEITKNQPFGQRVREEVLKTFGNSKLPLGVKALSTMYDTCKGPENDIFINPNRILSIQKEEMSSKGTDKDSEQISYGQMQKLIRSAVEKALEANCDILIPSYECASQEHVQKWEWLRYDDDGYNPQETYDILVQAMDRLPLFSNWPTVGTKQPSWIEILQERLTQVNKRKATRIDTRDSRLIKRQKNIFETTLKINPEKGVCRLTVAPSDDEDVSSLANVLIKKKTQILDLQNVELTADKADLLAPALKDLPSLRNVMFNNNSLSPLELASLSGVLTTNKNLDQLVLENNQIGDHGIRLLAALLAKGMRLRRLSVENTGMSAQGFQELFKAFETNFFLERLNASANQIGSLGIQLATESLSKNHSLQCLTLNNCNIGYTAVQYLQTVLRVNTVCQYLSLKNNPFTAGLPHDNIFNIREFKKTLLSIASIEMLVNSARFLQKLELGSIDIIKENIKCEWPEQLTVVVEEADGTPRHLGRAIQSNEASSGRLSSESDRKRPSFESGRERSSFESGRERSSFESGRERSSFESERERLSFESGQKRLSFDMPSEGSENEHLLPEPQKKTGPMPFIRTKISFNRPETLFIRDTIARKNRKTACFIRRA